MGRPLGSKNNSDIRYNTAIPMGDPTESEPQIAKRIDKTFRVLNKLTSGVVEKKLRGLVVSGCRGCGKTYAIENKLSSELLPDDFKIHSGSMSDVGLYKNLYKMRGSGQVFVADDCDEIYRSHNALNLLKAATDPKPNSVRRLSWGKESWALLPQFNEGETIPKEFEFYGSAIFCTNLNLRKEAERNTNNSKHIGALVDRSPYLDLGIHTKREILVRIWQVMEQTNFLEENEIPVEMGSEILIWIRDNIASIESPSIRTAVQLSKHMKIDPDNWEEFAEVTMFKR